ncbi:hypothetical protein FOA52_006304 [Chlamydomonas sp. UWO 241]|nr:hypothetical protein FOA52_006304 [Chlamydomonas sp. UWO 241]
MSSLAAARADNFYHPPDFDPKKHGTLNKYNGQHALRERAAKIDQGILVIRFEVPFNLYCTKCGEMVAKGERFNAEKKAIGNYHSTKIWEFSMAHHCGSSIVIVTDPKNSQYSVVEGARQKVEEYTAADSEVIELTTKEERQRLRSDPLYRLEHGEAQKVKARTAAEEIDILTEDSHARHLNDHAVNKLLRKRLRAAKADMAGLEAKRISLGLSDDVDLLPESETDKIGAQIAFLSRPDHAPGAGTVARKAILSQSIFGGGGLGLSSRAAAGGLGGGGGPGGSGGAKPMAPPA